MPSPAAFLQHRPRLPPLHFCNILRSYGVKSPSWDDIRKFIRREDFISGILDFDARELLKDAKRLKQMRPYMDDPQFNFEAVNRSSKACGPLVKWIVLHVTRHTSHVTRHTSHVTRHTSHVTRHTSHVTRHTSHR